MSDDEKRQTTHIAISWTCGRLARVREIGVTGFGLGPGRRPARATKSKIKVSSFNAKRERCVGVQPYGTVQRVRTHSHYGWHRSSPLGLWLLLADSVARTYPIDLKLGCQTLQL